MIDRDHPAVDAADRAARRWMEDRELETDLDGTAYMLTAALPHLTADDLRNTPAGQALKAEAYQHAADTALAIGDNGTAEVITRNAAATLTHLTHREDGQ